MQSPPPPPPTHPGEWHLAQIQEALSRPLPEKYLSKKMVAKREIKFLTWRTTKLILDKYAPGWRWEITTLTTSNDRLFLAGRLTIPTADGEISRDATGTELLKRLDDGELKEIPYGDPSSNAESMAFRRAAAKFGLALYLYGD